MTGERILETIGDTVNADVEAPSDPVRSLTGTHETTLAESLSEIQAEPVMLRNRKPIWAARNPQNPM